MWAKCLTKIELIEIFKKLQSKFLSNQIRSNSYYLINLFLIYQKVNENQLDAYITLINSNIDQFNLSISRGLDSENGDVYYALHCISENNISKLASIYSANQLEVLKAALEMVITRNGRFKAKKIVKIMLNKNVKFPVIEDIYTTIGEFAKERYFQSIGDYYYILPRGLIEFNTYFRTYYANYVKDCILCKAICTRPLVCKHCQIPYHKICSDRYSEQQDKCFSCNKSFELNSSIDSTRSVDANQSNAINQISEWLNEQEEEENHSDAESDEAMETQSSSQQLSQSTQ